MGGVEKERNVRCFWESNFRPVLFAVSILAAQIFDTTQSAADNAQTIGKNLCDVLAAVPDDPNAVTPGVYIWNMKAEKAYRACGDAVKQYPSVDRFKFQLQISKAIFFKLTGRKYSDLENGLNELGKNGYNHAYFMLYEYFKTGYLLPVNITKMEFYSKKAKASGSYAAQAEEGYLELKSQSKKIVKIAVQKIHRAARQGNSGAQATYGMIVWEYSEIEGSRWLLKSARAGNPMAMYFYFLKTSEPGQIPETSLNWLTKAAESNHPAALNYLSGIYEVGRGVPKNSTLSKKYKNKLKALYAVLKLLTG